MKQDEEKNPVSLAAGKTALVARSDAPDGLPYADYKPYLQIDFLYSCAYCTIAESEATTIRFTIDHYEPRRARPDLENRYDNLMYCCDTCNTYKNDITPPANARAAGVRYFRPDTDHRSDHFETKGIRVEGRTPIGEFTETALTLNRLHLRKLREIRSRLTACEEMVANGVLGLRNFPLDRLPPSIRGRTAAVIARAEATRTSLAEQVDELLKLHAKSPLDDATDAELRTASEEAHRRLANLKGYEALHPGIWRARNMPKGGKTGE